MSDELFEAFHLLEKYSSDILNRNLKDGVQILNKDGHSVAMMQSDYQVLVKFQKEIDK